MSDIRSGIRRPLGYLLVAGLATALASSVSGQSDPGSGNVARGQVDLAAAFATLADTLENVPVPWNQKWQFDVFNVPDSTGQAIVNPTFELETTLPFTFFSRPPDLFSTPTYIWNFTDLQIDGLPPRHLAEHVFLTVWSPSGTLVEAPRVRLTRSATPQVLTAAETVQTVTATLTIEEPIDFGTGMPAANAFHVSIGDAPIAYAGYTPVAHQFVSQAATPGWFAWSTPQQTLWAIDPQLLQVGQSYTFQAVFKTIKAPDLVGSPIHMPTVSLGYAHREAQAGPSGSTFATIQHPLEPVTLTFRTDSTLDWERVTTWPRRDIVLNGRVSSVTPPPIRRVIVPAAVRIEPEVVNRRSQGVITAFVQVPAPYRIEDIDASTVRCQGAPATFSVVAGDTLMLKCKVQQLQGVMWGSAVEMTVNGLFADGSLFEGIDIVRAIR